jgi:hypothetical protein
MRRRPSAILACAPCGDRSRGGQTGLGLSFEDRMGLVTLYVALRDVALARGEILDRFSKMRDGVLRGLALEVTASARPRRVG